MNVDENTRHCTASAVVVDPRQRMVLLVHHRTSQWWQFPGGHVEEGEAAHETAVREVREETGATATVWPPVPEGMTRWPYGRVLPMPFVVADHPAPAKPDRGEPAHRHIDHLYILVGDSTAPLQHQPREVKAAQWVPINTINTRNDATIRPDIPQLAHEALRAVINGLPGLKPALPVVANRQVTDPESQPATPVVDFVVPCRDTREPDGAICPGEVRYGPSDLQARCTVCRGWRGRYAPGDQAYSIGVDRGFAIAVEMLRDDARYEQWWSALPQDHPDYGYWSQHPRRQFADYLTAVGPWQPAGQGGPE